MEYSKRKQPTIIPFSVDISKPLENQFPNHRVYGDILKFPKWSSWNKIRKIRHLKWAHTNAQRYEILDNGMVRMWRRDGRSLLSDDCYISRCMMDRSLLWQPKNIRIFRHLLKRQEGIVCDIGASIGMNALEYASWGKQVYAFEPSQDVFDILHSNIIENDATSIQAFCHGLGDVDELRPFRDGRGQALGHGQIDKLGTMMIQTKRLDSLELPKISGIKIDVEGFEYQVIFGGLETIKKDLPIIQWESSPSRLKKWNYSPKDIVKLLQPFGYTTISKTGARFEASDLNAEQDFWSIPQSLFTEEYKIVF